LGQHVDVVILLLGMVPAMMYGAHGGAVTDMTMGQMSVYQQQQQQFGM